MAHPNAGGPLTYFARSNSVWCHGRPCWPPEGLGATIVAKLLWINKFSHPVGKLLATPMVPTSLFRSATQRPCSLDSNINPGFHIIVRSSRMPAIDRRRLQNWSKLKHKSLPTCGLLGIAVKNVTDTLQGIVLRRSGYYSCSPEACKKWQKLHPLTPFQTFAT